MGSNCSKSSRSKCTKWFNHFEIKLLLMGCNWQVFGVSFVLFDYNEGSFSCDCDGSHLFTTFSHLPPSIHLLIDGANMLCSDLIRQSTSFPTQTVGWTFVILHWPMYWHWRNLRLEGSESLWPKVSSLMTLDPTLAANIEHSHRSIYIPRVAYVFHTVYAILPKFSLV